MTKISFFIANPNRKISSLNLVISNWNNHYKFSSGVKDVVVTNWSKTKQRASESKYDDGIHINNLIKNIEIAAKTAVRDYELKNVIPNPEQLRQSILTILNPVSKSPADNSKMVPFIEQFIKDVSRAKMTINRYNTTLLMITNYEKFIGKKLSWSDMDMNFYNNFQKWMYNQDRSINYFGDMIKNIKMFVHAAEEAKLHEVKLPKNFKTVSETADSIYLNIDELIKLHELVIDEKLILDNHDIKIVNVNGNLERKNRRPATLPRYVFNWCLYCFAFR